MSKTLPPRNAANKANRSLGRKRVQLEVNRRSLDTQAADGLREAILTGTFKPGERLTEEVIADVFQLSRGTIRASLRHLVHEGLIVQEPYRGYSVTSLSSRDAWELFTLRNTLEAFAAKLLAGQIDAAKRVRLDQAFGRLVKAAEANSRQMAIDADFHLHQTISELTDHTALQAHYALIAGRVRLYQSLVSKFLSLRDYVVLHEPLIAAIRDGDTSEAERLASNHNTADGEQLVAWLREQEQARENAGG